MRDARAARGANDILCTVVAGESRALARVLGVPGAVMLGLGSILGTGIFVSIGLGAAAAGSWVPLAIAIAAAVATCNGLSSAQLAAAHPVSGGTYEYGYRVLSPTLGFVAGWTFLCAKSASAATAALGFAAYLFGLLGTGTHAIAVAIAAVAIVTAIVSGGIQRSHRVNLVIVAITIAALATFAARGLTVPEHGSPATALDASSLLRGTALMFVAFTGYGRIATLGEEVRDPAHAIPRAIVITLVVSAMLYVAVAFAAIHAAGADGLAAATDDSVAPLAALARAWSPGLATFIALGAITAMLGVLLNLVLGLSRVVLAMARRGDMPSALARVDDRGSPRAAVIVVGTVIAALALVGSVEHTWSFSAFTVLVYYALTNLCALRLPAAQRRFPRWIAALGLVACLGLAFWVEPAAWIAGLVMIAAGLVWHAIARRPQ